MRSLIIVMFVLPESWTYPIHGEFPMWKHFYTIVVQNVMRGTNHENFSSNMPWTITPHQKNAFIM